MCFFFFGFSNHWVDHLSWYCHKSFDTWAMKKTLIVSDYTTQLYGDYNTPWQGSLIIKQPGFNGRYIRFFFSDFLVARSIRYNSICLGCWIFQWTDLNDWEWHLYHDECRLAFQGHHVIVFSEWIFDVFFFFEIWKKETPCRYSEVWMLYIFSIHV